MPNVGIGTTNPTQALYVNGNIEVSQSNGQFYGRESDTTTIPSFSWPTSTNTGMWLANVVTNEIGFTMGGTTFVYFKSSAVGIGTASPVNALDVNGAAALGSYAGTTGPTGGLLASGKVGIGTSNPSSTLEVVGSVVADSGSAGSAAFINFGTGNVMYSSSTSGTINICGLKDGGAYTLLLTNETAGSTVTINAFPTYSSSTSCAGTQMTVDMGGGSTTLTTSGVTTVITFIYLANRGANGVVYGSAMTGFSN